MCRLMLSSRTEMAPPSVSVEQFWNKQAERSVDSAKIMDLVITWPWYVAALKVSGVCKKFLNLVFENETGPLK